MSLSDARVVSITRKQACEGCLFAVDDQCMSSVVHKLTTMGGVLDCTNTYHGLVACTNPALRRLIERYGRVKLSGWRIEADIHTARRALRKEVR